MNLFKRKIFFTVELFLILLIILNVVFIFSYEIFLKYSLLKIIDSNPDYLDRIYYQKIFSQITFSSIIVTIFLLLLYLFWHRISKQLKNGINTDFLVWYFIISNIIVQITILTFIDTIPISDSEYYINLAIRLTQNGQYTHELGFPTAFWPVGLPAIIAMIQYFCSDFLLVFKIINVIISSLIIFILYNLFKGFLSKKQMFLFLALMTFSPNNLFSVNVVMSDFPFTLFLWILIYILFRRGKNYFIWAGILLGIMYYLRPSSLLLPIGILIILIISIGLRKGVLKTIIITSISVLILLPWTIRNYNVFNRIVPVSTNGGFNFLMGNHPKASGGVNFDFTYDLNYENEAKEELRAYKKGLESIYSEPIRSILRLPMKIIYSYYRGDSSITWALKNTKNEIPNLFISLTFFVANFLFYIIVIGSVISFIINRKTLFNIIIHKVMITIFIYFTVIILLYFGNERYLIPIFPIQLYFFTKIFKF